jgi:MFS family permease
MADARIVTDGSDGEASAWSPFAVPAFRTVWIATLVANVGSWMASVATGWLMTTLDPSPIWVSLVGTATALPMFLFALPAGALADIVDRRKLLIAAQFFMLAVMIVLCVLTVTGWVTPIVLLILIFVLETGSAFETPAFLAVLPELVPKRQLSAALALNGLGINISRILGPALGGLVIGALGVSAAFLINALAFLGVVFAFARWQAPAHTSHLPAERFTAAIRSGWRFTREAPELKATLVHAGAFFLFASSYLALLPLIARDQLAGGANVYGVLFGCIGAGAVAGALVLPRVRDRTTPDRLVLGGGLVTAVATAALAVTRELVVAVPIMLVIGAAWLAVMSSLMVSAQVALPEWVKARGLAVTQMVFNGGLMFGSVIWGVAAERFGIPVALLLSAAGLALASVATLRWSLPRGESLDLRPSLHWPAPVVAGTLPADRGPVMVTVEYVVALEQRDAFAAALAANAHIRRRDGAIYWHHFIDTADPRRHVEVFVVESWIEHMRQHERVTRSDQVIEAQIRKFHIGPEPPEIRHFISATSPP